MRESKNTYAFLSPIASGCGISVLSMLVFILAVIGIRSCSNHNKAAAKEELLKDFVRVGDLFKHPNLYQHKVFTGSKGWGISAASDGTLHNQSDSDLYVAIGDKKFFIKFSQPTSRGQSDINAGLYSLEDLPYDKRDGFEDLEELTDYLNSSEGMKVQDISIKTDHLIYKLGPEETEAFRKTLLLARIFDELD
jgi:hypothetical protein